MRKTGLLDFMRNLPYQSLLQTNPEVTFASMGIYLFNTRVLVKAIIDDAKQDTNHDFGKNIIPEMIHSKKVYAYPFVDENNNGLSYWRDIGTLDAYWEANMDLVQTVTRI